MFRPRATGANTGCSEDGKGLHGHEERGEGLRDARGGMGLYGTRRVGPRLGLAGYRQEYGV